MRIVLVFVLALMGFSAFAQEGSQYIGTKEGAVRVRGTLYADSGFYLPKRQLRSARIYDTGAVYYQLSDSSAYVWTGSQWNKIGSETTTAGNLINKSSGVFSFPGTWSADVSLDGAVSTNPTRSWIMQNLYQFKVTDGAMAIGMPGEASFSPYMGTKYSPNNDFDSAVSVRATRTKVSGGNVIVNGNTSVKVTGSPLTTSDDTTTYKPAALASDGTLKRMASWPVGSGGSGISGLTTNRIPYASSSTTIADNSGLTYSPSLRELTTDSIDLKTLKADTGIFVGTGRYDYDNSYWRPGIRFATEDKTGIARLAGITTFIDNGAKNVGIWREGADVDVIFGYGANRLTVESTGSMNHVSLVGRMEFEGLGNGGYIDWVGYQAGSSLGRTIRITTDASSYGNSVVPIHFVPRNGFHAFRITDSVNAVKMHFSSQGWLGIGNDTAQRAIHVRNNGDVYERLESLSLTGIIGHEYYVQGNEKWSNKIDINSGQITENIGSGGYFKRWQINGTNAIGLDADRTVFVNNRLFVGTTSSLGIGEKLAVNGTIAIADGNQVVEPSGISGFRISTSAGTDIFYGSGATQGKVQMNPHMSYIYNSIEKFRVSSAGEVWINPAGVADLGAFTLQNTGGTYLNGSLYRAGINNATGTYKVKVQLSDSTEAQATLADLSTAMGTDTMYAKRGVTVSADSIVLDNTTETITSGTATTIASATHVVIVDPASVLASHTITLPAAPYDKQEVAIYFGGTVAGNATVVTTLTISANTGQALMQKAAPSTALGGDCFIYKYVSSNAKWYRKQ